MRALLKESPERVSVRSHEVTAFANGEGVSAGFRSPLYPIIRGNRHVCRGFWSSVLWFLEQFPLWTPHPPVVRHPSYEHTIVGIDVPATFGQVGCPDTKMIPVVLKQRRCHRCRDDWDAFRRTTGGRE
jgi:hypothetical protein